LVGVQLEVDGYIKDQYKMENEITNNVIDRYYVINESSCKMMRDLIVIK